MCTIESMTNSDSSTTDRSRSQALNRIREAENERLIVERSTQKHLLFVGIIVGATVGMLFGYLATLVTIVDGGVGEFGFQFYRPNFVNGFLRLTAAYMIGGGAVGGGLCYALFTSRQEAKSVIRWLIVGIFFAITVPLLVGFLLPTTFLIFVDIPGGLRPGLWLSAFVETFLGSFLDGYIFMVKTLYAGFACSLLFLVIAIGTYIASQRITPPQTDSVNSLHAFLHRSRIDTFDPVGDSGFRSLLIDHRGCLGINRRESLMRAGHRRDTRR